MLTPYPPRMGGGGGWLQISGGAGKPVGRKNFFRPTGILRAQKSSFSITRIPVSRKKFFRLTGILCLNHFSNTPICRLGRQIVGWERFLSTKKNEKFLQNFFFRRGFKNFRFFRSPCPASLRSTWSLRAHHPLVAHKCARVNDLLPRLGRLSLGPACPPAPPVCKGKRRGWTALQEKWACGPFFLKIVGRAPLPSTRPPLPLIQTA